MDFVAVVVLATLCAAMQCIVVRAPSTTWQRIWSPELGWCTWFSASSSHWLLSSCSGVRRGRRAALRFAFPHCSIARAMAVANINDLVEAWDQDNGNYIKLLTGRSCWRLLHCPLLPRLCASPTIQGGQIWNLHIVILSVFIFSLLRIIWDHNW